MIGNLSHAKTPQIVKDLTDVSFLTQISQKSNDLGLTSVLYKTYLLLNILNKVGHNLLCLYVL